MRIKKDHLLYIETKQRIEKALNTFFETNPKREFSVTEQWNWLFFVNRLPLNDVPVADYFGKTLVGSLYIDFNDEHITTMLKSIFKELK